MYSKLIISTYKQLFFTNLFDQIGINTGTARVLSLSQACPQYYHQVSSSDNEGTTVAMYEKGDQIYTWLGRFIEKYFSFGDKRRGPCIFESTFLKKAGQLELKISKTKLA